VTIRDLLRPVVHGIRDIEQRLQGLPNPTDFDRPGRAARAMLRRLWWRSRFSSAPVTDPSSGIVVSLTTFGPRLQEVHFAIESIAAGRVLPSRLILWLDSDDDLHRIGPALRRLQRRGLEILATNAAYRSHTKYFGYIAAGGDLGVALALADDDLLYPHDWLSRLVEAHASTPEDMVCWRAHRIVIRDGRIAPYEEWVHAGLADQVARFSVFGTSGAGQLLPPRLLHELARLGTAFFEDAAGNDDLWMHATAVRIGMRSRLVTDRPTLPPYVPGTQERSSLWAENGAGGGNDRMVAALYDAALVERIASDAIIR